MEETDNDNSISSKIILEKTGISRATLNNYIKSGIIPPPDVRRPADSSTKARRIGYFNKSVLDAINDVRQYKAMGLQMDEIKLLFASKSTSASGELFSYKKESLDAMQDTNENKLDRTKKKYKYQNVERRIANRKKLMDSDQIQLTIDDLNFPAYLINHEFEIEWTNSEAEDIIFGQNVRSIKTAERRNVFRLLIDRYRHNECQTKILEFHISIFAKRFSKEKLENLFPVVTRNEIDMLTGIYERLHEKYSEAESGVYMNMGGSYQNPYHARCIHFREGTLCLYAPTDEITMGMVEMLSMRGKFINEILKQRLPKLVSFSVLVADLQDSVRICAELPPDEYFGLINQIWKSMAVSFNRYYGTFGKHTGDGMVYYFLKNKDTNYIMNAILCALELKDNIKKLSDEWRIKKGWFNDLFMNVGINEGEEYFGTVPSAPSIEFTALGDSVNHAGRISELARDGSIWTTKNLMNRLTDEERQTVRYGIPRAQQDGNGYLFIEKIFSRVMDLIPPGSSKSGKFMDIATLPVTEIKSIS